MDRRTLLAIFLCLLVFFGWNKFYVEPQLAARRAAIQAAANNNNVASVNPTTSSASSQSNAHEQNSAKVLGTAFPPETREVSSSVGIAQVSNQGKFFTGWSLKGYKLGISNEASAVDLRSVTNEVGEGELAFDQQDFAYLNTVSGKFSSIPNGVRWDYEDQRVKLTRELSSNGQQNYLDLKITADFKGKRPNFAFVSLASQASEKDPEAQDRQLLAWSNESLERVVVKNGLNLKEISTPVKWIGASNRYFLMALVAENSDPKGLVQPLGAQGGRVNLVYPLTDNRISIPLRVYFGPKELDILRSVDPALDHAVDLGWFTFFAYPLLKLLKWLYQFVHNYGVAIVILTVLLKVVTYPLTYKSMKSMKEMAKLQPQLQKLREKYKDDRETLNREMLIMMRSHGYNPMAGCLPIVIQMPVFFALYRVLYSSIELYHAPFAGWIADLSSKDPFYVTPILLGLTMFIQQRLTPNTAADPTQARMMQIMPLMFTVFMINLPAGLTLYMLTNALASIIQQLILNKKLDTRRVSAFATNTR